MPQGLLNELITQIKRFKEGSTNSLSETIEEAKKALDKRSSDGKTFLVPSNNPLRSKIKYQLNKAISVKSTEQSPVEITSRSSVIKNSSDISCEKNPRQYYREDVDKFGDKWQNTFTFYSCSYCLYSGPRTDFKKIDDCDPYTKLLYKTIKDEYFSKLRLSRIHQIIKAADVIEVQLNADGSFPGTISSIYF